MTDTPSNQTQQQLREWARKQLLEGAAEGLGVSRQLMIGSTPVANGLTFEAARDELYKLIEEGLIELTPGYVPQLTERGRQELSKQ